MPVTFSIEVFPPRDAAAQAQFDSTVTRLSAMRPSFCSVTYGAGGSAREGSTQAIRRLRDLTDHVVAAHLTCANQTKEQTNQIAQLWWAQGIRHIVALRGDLDRDAAPLDCSYRNAAELVTSLRSLADFEISVACYPEGHPEASDQRADLHYLQRKLDAGATRAISQFFFEPETFLRFRDAAVGLGVTKPLVPGILPILDLNKVSAFARRCGASVPVWLADRFTDLEHDAEARGQVAASLAVSLCERLISEGVQSFHFYTLNRPTLTLAVCRALGFQPTSRQAA